MDALQAKIDSGGTKWMLGDLIGSIRDITNGSGSLLDHRDWDAFGNLTAESSPSNGDRYGYTGREWQTELNLQYNRARWYDPVTKRWLSQDPLGFGAGDSNLYRYVGNQPTLAGDASGMFPGDALDGGSTGSSKKETDRLIKDFKAQEAKAALPSYTPPPPPAPKQAGEAFLESLVKAKPIAPPTLPWDRQLGVTPGDVAKAQEDAEAMRFTLNSMGMIKGLGYPAAALSAVIAFAEGDYLEGILWLVQMNRAKLLSKSAQPVAMGPNVGLTPVTDVVRQYAPRVTPISGFTDVFIHGNASGNAFMVLHNGDWITLSHRSLGTYLRHQRVTGNIRLISCNAGAGSLAQNLANRLGVTIKAPTNIVYVHPNGSLTVPSGVWQDFMPGIRP